MKNASRPLADNLEKWVHADKVVDVSDEGRVRLRAGALLELRLGPGGYLYVDVPRDGVVTAEAVHLLVVKGFLKVTVEHVRFRNRNRRDTRPGNLTPVGPPQYYRARRKAAGKKPRPLAATTNPELLGALSRLLAKRLPKTAICLKLKISRATLYRCLAILRPARRRR